MRIIELDAARWKRVLDFYEDLLEALDAPYFHGRNINALYDSIIWGGINGIEPPYVVRIHNFSQASEEARDEVSYFLEHLPAQEREYESQNGEASGVVFELVA